MNCILYTNCVGSLGLKPIFNTHPSIKSIIYYHNYIEDEYPTDEELINCDLFIFQYSSKESIDKYTSKLPVHCKQISFPYIYDDGTFSIHYGTGGFTVIDKLLKKGHSKDEILTMYDDNLIDFELPERRKKSIEILKKKEICCTIKISDFIESNRDKPLFFTHNHPTIILTIELCNRICAYLNIKPFEIHTPGWLYGCHLDMTGFCHFPGNKLESTLKKSMLHIDKYSLQNQVKCLHKNHIEKIFI